jgi:transposase
VGRRGYPAEFRRRVLDLVAAGRKVGEVAADLGISEQTIYSWRRQDRIDRGLEAGLATVEKVELVALANAIFDYLETPHQPKASSGSCRHACREGLVGVVDDVGDEAVVELADEFVE